MFLTVTGSLVIVLHHHHLNKQIREYVLKDCCFVVVQHLSETLHVGFYLNWAFFHFNWNIINQLASWGFYLLSINALFQQHFVSHWQNTFKLSRTQFHLLANEEPYWSSWRLKAWVKGTSPVGKCLLNTTKIHIMSWIWHLFFLFYSLVY